MEELEDSLKGVYKRLEDVCGDEHGSGTWRWCSGPEQPLVFHGVKSSAAPGIAAQQPPAGEHDSTEYAESLNGLDRVFRTAGVVTTALAEQRGEQPLIEPKREHGQPARRSAQARAAELSH
jgi:hypothetical protein